MRTEYNSVLSLRTQLFVLRIILYTGLGNLSWCFNMFQSWKHYFSSCGYPQTKKLIQSIGSDYETCFQIHCPSREGYMFGIIVVVKTYITTNMIIVTQVARRVLRGRLPVLDEAVQNKFPKQNRRGTMETFQDFMLLQINCVIKWN